MAKKPIDDDDDDDLSDFDFTEDGDEEFEGFDDDDDFFDDDEDDDEEELSESDNQISKENDPVQNKGSSVKTEENLEESPEEDLTEENEEAAQAASIPPNAETGPIEPDQIPVTLIVEIGQIEIPVHQLLKLEPGNMLELHTHPAHVVNLTINSKVVGKGELIRIGDILGVRLLQLGKAADNS